MTEPKKTDLSKIDFTKCELTEWNGRRLSASFEVGRPSIGFAGRELAYRRDGDWILLGTSSEPLSAIEALRPICNTVDAFIADETARIAREEKPETVEFDYEHSTLVPVPAEMLDGKWHLVATRIG